MATIDKMEQQLRPPTIGLKPYEPKVIPLITGEDMLVREITRDEVPLILETIEPLMKQPKDFYEMEIGTAGIMNGYMARRCDIYFTLERKLDRFLHMALGAYQVPRSEQDAIVSQICKLDICRIADSVIQKLFTALAMKFDFSLSQSENPPH